MLLLFGMLLNVFLSSGFDILQTQPNKLVKDMKLVLRCPSQKPNLYVVLEVSSQAEDTTVLLRNIWKCANISTKFAINLKFSDSLIYNVDSVHKTYSSSYYVILRTFLLDNDRGRNISFNINKHHIPVLPVYSRKFKKPNICFTIFGKLKYSRSISIIPKCKKDHDIITWLSIPIAFSENFYGVRKHIKLPKHKELKRQARENTSKFTFNAYIYLTENCSQHWCSIFHSIDNNINLKSPLLFINKKNKLFVEVQTTQGRKMAWQTDWSIPTHIWIYLQLTFDVNFSYLRVTVLDSKEYAMQTRYEYSKKFVIHTMGNYFLVIGGSYLFKSIQGYISNVTILPFKSVIQGFKKDLFFNGKMVSNLRSHFFDNKCIALKENIANYIYYDAQQRINYFHSHSCPNSLFESFKLMRFCLRKPKFPHKQKLLLEILKSLLLNPEKTIELRTAGSLLYSKTLSSIGMGMEKIEQVTNNLVQAACLDNSLAAYMIYVILLNGIGTHVLETHALMFALHSALHSNQLALLALGHKHLYGLNNYPKDMEVSFRYYSEAAFLYRTDREKHDTKDLMTEQVRLSEKEALQFQKGEDSDYVDWLKFQANQGANDAKEILSKMLFWGRQGVERNLKLAVNYYKELAETGNKQALYDYGVSVLRGQGTKQDKTKASQILKQSADQGNPNAWAALGWMHYEKKEYAEAKQYLEKAARYNVPDAIHNLGHMYMSGLIPNEKRNTIKAYELFIKGAALGQIDSAIALSNGLSIGEANLIPNIKSANIFARWVAEMSPVLGRIMREGLSAYLSKEYSTAVVYYAMAAETGQETACYNLGYICEEDFDQQISSNVESDCTRKYYNMSLFSNDPHPRAFNKLGDFHWYGCSGSRDLQMAASYYFKAAQKKNPEAFYNLGFLAENGVHIPEQLLRELSISPNKNLTVPYSLSQKMYEKCILLQGKAEDSKLPCSLALSKIKFKRLLLTYNMEIKGYSTILGTLVIVFLSACYQFRVRH